MKLPTLILLCSSLWIASARAKAQETDTPFPVDTASGFALAKPGVELAFPRDHGSHPDFKTEWWYITGHLESAERELGFQLTFFRSASRDSPSDKATQVYLAHAAVLDKRTGRFLHEERLNTEHWNAQAKVGQLDLYNGNWYLRMADPDTEKMQARFSLKDLGVLELTFEPAKEKVLFGDRGYSRKSDEGDASYYITFPRLQVSGTLKTQDRASPLAGIAWMDHEFSTSQLGQGQIGWNWSSLILDDGSELMAYVMRREDGTTDPNSRLTLISPSGETTEYRGADFAWTPLRNWESPTTGAEYPVEYQISWAEQTLRIAPFADAQELVGSIGDFVYWEGACRVLDANGQAIGLAYTELTGYTETLRGKF